MRTTFVLLGAGKPFSGIQHTALRTAGGNARVLDWTLRAVSPLSPSHHFICGYQADELKSNYPEFQYWYNPEWENSHVGWSLLRGLPDTAEKCLVSYADILFRRTTVKKLMKCKGDIAIAIDTHWRTRFSGRTDEDLERCEKVCVVDGKATLLGADIPVNRANAEFIGLASFSPSAVEALRALKNEESEASVLLREASLSDLIELLRIQGLKVTAVDTMGDWAELNEAADLARFVLGTKAQTLNRLRRMVKLSRIEEQVSFAVDSWQHDPMEWIDRIQERFDKKSVVVRSSAISEDGFTHSNAGAYTSLLNVDSSSVATLQQAIDTVIASYPDGNPSNEVLVQPMLHQVTASGVAFTRSLATGAPYYTINYDDTTGSTESITNGTSHEHKTLVAHRNANPSAHADAIPGILKDVLPALREIEELLGYDSLDVEFAVTETFGLHILQVRPIAVDHSSWGNADGEFSELLENAEVMFERLQPPSPFIVGNRTIFGVMPDWNPAEIIGTKPSLLATSLYRELITDEVWATQRAQYGYRDVRPHPLLASFAGQPYIDVRASFNSFIPAQVEAKLAARIVEFCLDWLEAHPELHDKVEFEVIPTCFDLDFARWRLRFLEYGQFSDTEIDSLESALKALTVNAISRNHKDFEAIDTLEARYNDLRAANLAPLEKACAYLDDARLYGTLPFAHLARSAFVAITLLRSAVATGVITAAEQEDFLNSIRTVSHELTVDARSTAEGVLNWEAFVQKYGHLRPGTYDITSLSYHQDPERFLRPTVEQALRHEPSNNTNGELWRDARVRLAVALNKAGLPGDADAIETFLREAIEGREYAKFAFTRHLSSALDELASWGESLGVSRDTLAHLNITDIRALRAGTLVVSNIGDWIREQAARRTKNKMLIHALELPPLIFKKENFSVFSYPTTQANYIGSKTITAECIDLERLKEKEDIPLEGLIVLIPQADPGYDWLFGRRIGGLITMYGGANSHMAIRAAEFGLPAAIGIGETHYRSLSHASELELNPTNRTIRLIH